MHGDYRSQFLITVHACVTEGGDSMDSKLLAEKAEPDAALQTFSLRATLAEVERKRAADAIRFRSCCADPRASK
jgi:hypothetical protein